MRAGWWPWVRRYSVRASLSSLRASASVRWGLAVGFGDGRAAAADDDAVAALVEDLGDGGVEFLAVGGPVKANADVAGGKVGVATRHPPGGSAGLVVQRDVQVPRAGGLVLEGPRGVAAPDGAFPGFPAHDLQRTREAERLGFEHVVEIPADLGVAGLLTVGVVAAGCGRFAVVLADLLGPGAQDDAATAGLGERPSRVGVQPGALGDGGLDVGLGEQAELPVGDLAD
jgi:hypothetical protein